MASAAFSRMPAKVPPTKRDNVTVDMTKMYRICNYVVVYEMPFIIDTVEVSLVFIYIYGHNDSSHYDGLKTIGN